MSHVAGVQAPTARSVSSGRGMRYRYRLIVSMLAVCIPLLVILAGLLTTRSSASLTRSAENGSVDVARAVTLRLEDWMSERHEVLTVAADQLRSESGAADSKVLLNRLQKSGGDFVLVEIVDLNGTITATDGERSLDVADDGWFRIAASGQSVTISPTERAGRIDWGSWPSRFWTALGERRRCSWAI